MSEGRPRGIGGVARRLRDRVKNARLSADEEESPAPSSVARRERRSGDGVGAAPADGEQRGLLGRIAADRKRFVAAQTELERLTAERDELRTERLGIQQELGAMQGKKVQPRLRVEKTNGVPSFIVAQRMMQRIYARTEDARAGLDGVGAVFADPAETARYAISHGVPVVEGDDSRIEPTVIAHAFKGQVPLVEVHGPGGVRHFDGDGTDLGDIRPATTHDPGIVEPTGLGDITSWSKRLSRFVPRPYVQIHWSATAEGPRLHHIDVDPDRVPVLTPEWDEKLGLTFDGAYTRYLKQPFRSGGLANRVPGGTFTPEEHA